MIPRLCDNPTRRDVDKYLDELEAYLLKEAHTLWERIDVSWSQHVLRNYLRNHPNT
jgi:hypothetical protein